MRAVTGVMLLASVLNAEPAAGQVAVAFPDCQQDSACLQLQEQAAERSKASDLVGALRLYKLAYEVRPDPRLLYNIARTLHKQGQATEAASYYQKFLDAGIQDEVQRQKAQDFLGQIQPTPLHPPPSTPALTQVAVTEAFPAGALRVDTVPTRKPIYRKWWFWTLTGASLAGIAVGIGLGIGLRDQVVIPSDRMVYKPTF
jgi:tetratricopeptide (TPR) repeat protein